MTTLTFEKDGAKITFIMYLEFGSPHSFSGHPDNWYEGSPEYCEIEDAWVDDIGHQYQDNEVEIDERGKNTIIRWETGCFEIQTEKLEEMAFEQANKDADAMLEP